MRCDMSGIVYGIGIEIIMFLTIGLALIFLNLNKKVRESSFYSLTSFFFIPFLITIISIFYVGGISESIKEYSVMFISFF